jgi:hypothetical protein
MMNVASETSSTTSASNGTTSDGLRVLSFDTFQLVLNHTFESSQIVRCCCAVVAVHAASDGTRFVCHVESMAGQLAAGQLAAGAIERHRERARDRLCRRMWTVLREPTCGRPRWPWEERARLRDGGIVASAPGAERMQAEPARGSDLAQRDGRARALPNSQCTLTVGMY